MSKTFDQSPIVSDLCPKCGAVTTERDSNDIRYACGTIYLDGQCDTQGRECFRNSHLVRRRAATICGILDACDDAERNAVIHRVTAYLNK